MAKSDQRRQQKLAKKQAKERRKRKDASRKQQLLASLAGKMTSASHGRIVRCGVTAAVTDAGLGYALIARQGPMGQVAIALMLVDTYCLGVKEAVGMLKSPSEAQELFERLASEQQLAAVSPGLVRGLVESSIAYARSLGFEPHPDYRKVAPIWGDIEAESVEGHFEFGRDGKPAYLRGPFDDFATQQFIVKTLDKNVGAGNYSVTIMGPATRGPMLEFDNADGEDSDDEDSDEDEVGEGLVGGDVTDNTINAVDYRRIDPEHP